MWRLAEPWSAIFKAVGGALGDVDGGQQGASAIQSSTIAARFSHATMEAQTGDPEQQEEDEPTTLILRPGQGAPAPNELTSSADEAEYDDDAPVRYSGNRLVKIVPLEIKPGAWAVLHGLEKSPRLNGLLERVCGYERPFWWPPRDEPQ